MINCLAYNLRFWSEHKDYELLYNSDHVISVPKGTTVAGFLTLDHFGYIYFKNWQLDSTDKQLLKQYFDVRKN